MRKRTASGGPVTGAELARHLDVDGRTIRKWKTEPGFPVAVRGVGTTASRYDETAVRVWRADRDQRKQAAAAGLTVARSRKELAQAREAEQRVAQRAATVIPADEARRIWSNEVARVRRILRRLPAALAGRLVRVGATDGVVGIERVLQEEVRRVLTELSTGETRKPQRSRKASRTRRTTRRKPTVAKVKT